MHICPQTQTQTYMHTILPATFNMQAHAYKHTKQADTHTHTHTQHTKDGKTNIFTNATSLCTGSTSIWSSPYAGQVRLRGSLPSQGIAEIYIKGQWESICYDNVQSFVADSVCRQLGYTNSKEIGISQT